MNARTSQVVQWFFLPMQRTWVRSLVLEDFTRQGATKSMPHNYWTRTLEPAYWNYWACVLKLLKLVWPSTHALQIAAAAAKSLQLCLTLCDPTDRSPPDSPHPWDSPGKNTGVGCYFLLQCMKVKSESEVTQLCPTPSDPMDYSLPGSSIHGIFPARVLVWGAIAFSICK